MRAAIFTGTMLFVSLGTVGCSGDSTATQNLPLAASGTSNVSAAKAHPMSARAMPIGQSVALCSTGKGGNGNQGQNGDQGGQTGLAACHSLQRTDIAPIANASVPLSSLPGLQPSDLRNAYGLTSAASGGVGQTVAIVVAYDNPLLESDLAVYRQEFNLPACSVASGCLTFVYGNKVKSSKNAAWNAESDLDAQMVSAICPNCKILVAEAPSNKIADLAATVTQAVSAGATVVSNSYSVPEDPSDLQYEANYKVPGVPMTGGAGDGAYGVVGYPASSQYVTAVGGTTLAMSGGSVLLESVWGSTESGCSAVIVKPSWQTDTGCAMRTVNDVAVVGDPATGVATYSSGLGGWNVFGGTSVGAPIVAGIYALAGNGKSISNASPLYAAGSQFHSIVGSSGSCSPTYLCTAATGYNGPAGLGTPYGVAAF